MDDYKVKGVGKSASSAGESVQQEIKTLSFNEVDPQRTVEQGGKVSSRQDVFVTPPGQKTGSRVDTPVFDLGDLDKGDTIEGPALIIDATQTIS